uniref:Uncharacterized protein n=1 Tax=Arundo donax TaxID=35708 RepID=A0A0A9AKR9_ARUDO
MSEVNKAAVACFWSKGKRSAAVPACFWEEVSGEEDNCRRRGAHGAVLEDLDLVPPPGPPVHHSECTDVGPGRRRRH